MEKVLLAIDGISPSKQILQYALQLSQRIRAQLNVLEIITPESSKEYVSKVRRVVNHTKRYFEGSMVAATFAEAGEHEMAKELMEQALENLNQLLPESEKVGKACQLALKQGHFPVERLTVMWFWPFVTGLKGKTLRLLFQQRKPLYPGK